MAQGNGTRTGFTPGSAAAAGLQHQKQDGQVSHPSQHDSPSWSCQQTQCAICLEVKEPGDMPFQVTSLCLHEPTVCKDCLKRWLQSDVKSGLWRDGLRCPVCRASLKWHDVKRWVSHETFEHYDRLLLQRTLSKHPTFHACLSPACESGQIYETRCPQFDCVACGQSYCIDHCVPWHANVTCEEYDDKSSLHAFAARASEGFIRTATETCPHCQRRVIKAGGCDHITCELPPSLPLLTTSTTHG
ncbi:hypothetical protein N658DRAFT_118884 [Parathielavia hyrcaniae]|uniref:RBR-type E3 ubiquitin transferase n=1 Tax=Parathielavia hyrcaniae TaxID=113614 RepID=A0AAN6T512_9PEZI|nr:hypothetical protein N658DRAFT_118884 [Parathielavia hyrcaniae]